MQKFGVFNSLRWFGDIVEKLGFFLARRVVIAAFCCMGTGVSTAQVYFDVLNNSSVDLDIKVEQGTLAHGCKGAAVYSLINYPASSGTGTYSTGAPNFCASIFIRNRSGKTVRVRHEDYFMENGYVIGGAFKGYPNGPQISVPPNNLYVEVGKVVDSSQANIGSSLFPSPSLTYIDDEAYTSCPASSPNWGASNFCGGFLPAEPVNTVRTVVNFNTGATGTVTGTCSASTGQWVLSGPSCTANLAEPLTLAATQGTIAGKVQLSWATVAGASSYDVQYRKAGSSTWTSAVGVASGWQLSTTDESVFEFQVRATNAVGAGPWGATATGYIRPQIMPDFVSQSVPTDVRVGASFSASQIWKNSGYTSWSDATFQLLQASGSGNFGSAPGTFSPAVVQNQNGTSTLALVAPSTPGTYSFSRQFSKDGVDYGSPSTPVSIKVWGDPVCSALTVNKPYVYELDGTVSAQFNANNQATSQTASVWNEAAGPATAKTYAPVYGAGMYKFDIPLANHGGQVGSYRVRVDVSNAVSSGSCEVTFELRALDTPVASLQALVGTGSTANSFAVGQTAAQAILAATVTRTENMALVVELLDGDGATAAMANLAAGSATVNLGGARWTGDAWSTRGYTLRARYADPGAASQGKNLDVPVTLILTPSGNTLALGIVPGHPLTATSAMGRGAQPYDLAAQGSWASKVAVQGGADLDTLSAMGESGQRSHLLDYSALVGKSLTAMARAMPPAGITLINPLEVSATVKIPMLPVRNLQATDGTLEDVVRVSWEPPAAGASGFTYDVYRDSELIQSGQTTNTLDDAPPVRGQEYSYRVVAKLSTDKSPESADPGHVPACRAARLIGASLNADMSAINGMLERWDCLAGMTATSAIDAQTPGEMPYAGSSVYRSFTVPVPSGLADGSHVLRVGMESEGVTLNASRTYDVPFNLNRASIAVNDLTILYNGTKATTGLEASSIGRFGIKMEGGSGIGFAEEIK